jgi:hypothetical protein
VSGHNPTEHAAEILRLDTEKFKIAKEASDLEIESERLESDIERTRQMAEECEAQGTEGGDAARRVEGMDDEIMYVHFLSDFLLLFCRHNNANMFVID